MDEPATRGPAPRGYQAFVVSGLLRAIERFHGETLTVMFPRQAGKNEVSAILVSALLVTHADVGGTIIHCAPTFEPQGRISFERTRAWLERTGEVLGAPIRVEGGNRLGVGRATATFLSGSPQASVAGHTASIALIGDEAQDLDTEWFERQFRPMAATTGAPTILFGTAWDGQSLLERAADRNRRLDGDRPGPVRRHYQVSWQLVSEVVPAYGAFVEQERQRLGPRHPLFLTQYALEPARGSGRLLGPEELAALAGRHPRLQRPIAGERYVGGLDLGGDRPDSDASVLTIGRVDGGRCEMVAIVAWQRADYAALVPEVVRLARRWGLARLCVDATGLGGPLAASLAHELGSAVEQVTFTAQVKSALGWGLVAAAGAGRLSLYVDDGRAETSALWRELRACRRDLRPGGTLRWGDDTGHDDHAISLALCLRAAGSAGEPRRARGGSRNRYD